MPRTPPLADRIRGSLARRIRTFRKAARRVAREPDGEAVHDLRVACRRLEAALAVWRDGRTATRALDAIARIRRRLGRVRETEALLEGLADLPAARAAATDLAKCLKRRRERARKQGRHLRPLLKDLRHALADSGNEARARRRTLLLGRFWIRARADALASRGDADLHQARIALKHWRYALEVLSEPPPRGLKSLQDVLGRSHDAAALDDYLAKHTKGNGPLRRAASARRRRTLRAALRRLAAPGFGRMPA